MTQVQMAIAARPIGDQATDPYDLAVRRFGGWCGIVGSVFIATYFIAPAFLGWPYGGASGTVVTAYANTHATLFFAGAWLQVTGTLLNVIFFLSLVHLARASAGLADLVTTVAAAVLLATVVVEAAFLVAVPIAAAAGDTGTADAMFTLSNGVFIRVFPLAPASATLIGLGLVLRWSGMLGRWIATTALGLGVAFELAGIMAMFSPVGLVATAVLSIGQGLWVLAASIGLVRSPSRIALESVTPS